MTSISSQIITYRFSNGNGSRNIKDMKVGEVLQVYSDMEERNDRARTEIRKQNPREWRGCVNKRWKWKGEKMETKGNNSREYQSWKLFLREVLFG